MWTIMKFFKSLNKFWMLVLLSIATIFITRCWNQHQLEKNAIEGGDIQKAIETHQY